MRLRYLLNQPGLKTVIAPHLTATPEEFRDFEYFENGVAADGFVLLSDTGSEWDEENVMRVQRDGNEEYIPLPDDRIAVDHHAGSSKVSRYTQRAACQQFCEIIAARGVEAFRDSSGRIIMNLFFNRCPDEDCAMVRALGKIVENAAIAGLNDAQIRALFASGTRLHNIVVVAGKMDVWVGGPLNVEENDRRILKKVLGEMNHLKREFLTMHPDKVEEIFKGIDVGLAAYLAGNDSGVDLKDDPGTMISKDGWTLVSGTQPDGRVNVRKRSVHELVIFEGRPNPEGRKMFSVAYWPKQDQQEQSSFPFAKFYYLLNSAEKFRSRNSRCSLDYILHALLQQHAKLGQSHPPAIEDPAWGGAEAGGCIPAGSYFVGAEFDRLMDYVVALVRGTDLTKQNLQLARRRSREKIERLMVK